MYEIAKKSNLERDEVLRIVASQKKVNVFVIEKDYWVCLVLNFLFSESNYKSYLTFKGGTSLSKGFNIIHRFSEDIDLILDYHVFGDSIQDMNIPRTKSQQEKYNKKIGEITQKFLKEQFVPDMIDGLKKAVGVEFDISLDERERQVVIFKYPTKNKSGYLLNYIRLEIGPLAALTPVVNVEIKPYVFDCYPNLFSNKFNEVRTVAPERTFWEKATILYREAYRPIEKKMPIRYSRHYYDLYMLGHSVSVTFHDMYAYPKISV